MHGIHVSCFFFSPSKSQTIHFIYSAIYLSKCFFWGGGGGGGGGGERKLSLQGRKLRGKGGGASPALPPPPPLDETLVEDYMPSLSSLVPRPSSLVGKLSCRQHERMAWERGYSLSTQPLLTVGCTLLCDRFEKTVITL